MTKETALQIVICEIDSPKAVDRVSLISDCVGDSLDYVHFIQQLERVFLRDIPNEFVVGFSTLGDVADWISANV